MRKQKALAATLLAAQIAVLPLSTAAEPETGFGAYESADWQTRLIACDKAIYERDWYVYDRGILKAGGLNAEQAEAAYEASRESGARMLFFSALAKYDNDAYKGKLKQVDDANSAMYERDKDSAVKEYKRLGDFCLSKVYPALIASSTKAAELDKSLRNIHVPDDLMKAAKADFMAKAMKSPTE